MEFGEENSFGAIAMRVLQSTAFESGSPTKDGNDWSYSVVKFPLASNWTTGKTLVFVRRQNQAVGDIDHDVFRHFTAKGKGAPNVLVDRFNTCKAEALGLGVYPMVMTA